MGKPTGFLEFDRQTPEYKAVPKRIQNYKEFVEPLSEEEIKNQGARCMDCGVPFCHSGHGCPLGNIIPDFNDQIYNGKWQAALKTLLSTNNFPEFTGRICPAPCETACVLGINEPPVTIKNIEVSIIDKAFQNGWIKPQPPEKRTGKKVAIVGSGPAGLAAADQLNKAGHTVTVYERADRIGGLLRLGIPDFKLDKDVVQRRVDLMEQEGVKFVTNANVGVNVSAKKLQEENDALVLAGGSTLPRDLPIDGRDAEGIHYAMNFLGQNNKRVSGTAIDEPEILATGKKVVVIGGGDTGSDCVGTSIRQKAESVLQIELMPRPPQDRTELMPWPRYPMIFRTSSSQAEGCDRDFAIMSKEFIRDEQGQLTGIRAVRLKWDKPQPGVRPNFEEEPDSEFVIPADMVLLAMGFLHPEHDGVLAELDLQKDQRGNVKADEGKYATSTPGVYAAGDMRRGQSLVVWAISEGRECAKEVDQFLCEAKESRLQSKAQSFCEVSS